MRPTSQNWLNVPDYRLGASLFLSSTSDLRKAIPREGNLSPRVRTMCLSTRAIFIVSSESTATSQNLLLVISSQAAFTSWRSLAFVYSFLTSLPHRGRPSYLLCWWKFMQSWMNGAKGGRTKRSESFTVVRVECSSSWDRFESSRSKERSRDLFPSRPTVLVFISLLSHNRNDEHSVELLQRIPRIVSNTERREM